MASEAATVTVTIGGAGFTPSLLKTAVAGDTVRFSLTDGTHDAVSYAGGPLNSGLLGSSKTSYDYAYPGGNVYYRCTLHSSLSTSSKSCIGMCGVITDQTTTPSIPIITSPSDGATIDQAPMPISGTGTPLAKIAIYEGTKVVGSSIVETDGTWTTGVVFATTGFHTVSAKSSQPNTAVPPSGSSLPITVDVTRIMPDVYAPYVQLQLATTTWTTAPIIKGDASDSPTWSPIFGKVVSVRYTLTDILGSTTIYDAACARCPASFVYFTGSPRGLLPGRYTVRASATDDSGNVGVSGPLDIIVLAPPA